LDGVGSTKDVFLTSLEMLAGALPVAKKDKKDKKVADPLRHSIDNIKTKTKVEAFTRAELAERKDDLLRYAPHTRNAVALTH
jgi:3-methyladenine DNA glycosylase AlkC